MANTRSNVYKPTARKSLRQNSPRSPFKCIQVGQNGYPFQDKPYNCNLHLQIVHCLLNFSMPVFFFLFFFFLARDSSRLSSAISTTNSSYEIYIVHVEIIREITVSCDTLIELATLSNLYFSTLLSILHTHDPLLSSSSNCVLKIKLVSFTTFFTTIG